MKSLYHARMCFFCIVFLAVFIFYSYLCTSKCAQTTCFGRKSVPFLVSKSYMKMDRKNGFDIDLLGAGLQGQCFTYEIDDAFFENFDGPVIRGSLHTEVECKSVSTRRMSFTVHSVGTVVVPCDRCLSDLELRIDTTDMLDVELGDDYSDNGDVLTVPEDQGLLDMSQPIYEFIVLSLPLKRVHEPGMCDEAMMDVYNRHQTARSSQEETADHSTPADSRWDVLKKLVENNN